MPAPSQSETPLDLWLHERAARRDGKCVIAGVDEAGRGPLAGPVIAAAIILPEHFDLTGITDSKKLTHAAREAAFTRLCETPGVLIGVGGIDAPEIDRLNILRATHQAMRLAVQNLPVAPDVVLVDGLPVRDLNGDCRSLVKGDSLSASIAAASIVAKVTRDRMMCGLYHEQYPAYNFPRHKGYGTAEHLAALTLHGPCPLHRRSFAPVAQSALRFDE